MSGVRAMQNTVDNFICGLVIKVHNCYSLLVKLSDSFMVLQSYIGWVLDFVRAGSAVRTAHFATAMWLTAIKKSTESNYFKLPSDEFNVNIVIINVQLLHVAHYFYCSAR